METVTPVGRSDGCAFLTDRTAHFERPQEEGWAMADKVYPTRQSPYRQAADHRYKSRIKEKRRAANLCLYCGATGTTIRKTDIICLRCWFRAIAGNRTGSVANGPMLQENYESQGRRCAYTGVELIPGVNASLDQMTPRGGTNERDNLQWLDERINSMKVDRTHEEFVSLCRRIAEQA
jgi:hypothetical protein